MYEYEDDFPLTLNSLLAKYSQEDIFRIVFKEYPDLDILYLSPFREDHNPNCFFEWYKGRLYFRDYADKQRDCFQAVKDFHDLYNYHDTMQFIVDYLANNPVPEGCKPIKVYDRKERDCAITFRIREYAEKDNLYWKQYGISEVQLREDKVSIIYWYRFYSERSGKWIILRPFDVCYAISGFESRCKIYRPQNHCRKSRWLTNCKVNDVGNLSNIDPTGDVLIITKSYKDCRVIRNQGYKNVIWFQSESMIPNDPILLDLLARFDRFLIFYDNDLAGIKGSNDLQLKLQSLSYYEKPIRNISSPYSYLKDPAEMVSVRGEQELKDFLAKQIHLLHILYKLHGETAINNS